MIHTPHSYIILIIAIYLSSCAPGIVATPTNARSPSPILISPTFTITPTETRTPISPATLTPLQSNERIRTYLQEPICPAPCFWGITPEQTTLVEATNVFTSLGLQLENTYAKNNQEFFATSFHLGDDLELDIVLGAEKGIIKTLDVSMTDTSETGTPRVWSTYSPENLIQRYGTPSNVEFSLGRASPNPNHTMVLYFESVDIIVLYLGEEKGFLKNRDALELCPLVNKVDFIKFWMGSSPLYPPPPSVPLNEATSVNLEDFSKLMLGDPNKACFNLKDEAFH